jgi:hydrogenase 3 maturation protease
MPELRNLLEKYFAGARKIGILAVGSELRGDDAAGLLIAQKLKAFSKTESLHSKLKIFIGATAPENLTGEIKKFNPDHLVVLDAADTGKKPGAIMSISPEEVGGVSFSTHQLPLKLMIQYLNESISCAVTIIGIQPKSLEFNTLPCKEVKAAAAEVAQSLQSALRKILS